MSSAVLSPYMISTDAAVGEWVASKMKGSFHADSSVCIGLLRGDAPVAGVIYENWNGASLVCHVAATRLTPRYLAAIFHYPFCVCGAVKIIAPVAETNTACRALVEHMGFTEEGRLGDAAQDGSAMLLYTLHRDACRYLSARYQSRLEHAHG